MRASAPFAVLFAVHFALTACAAPPSAQTASGNSSNIEAREHFRRGLELSRQGLHDGAAAEFQSYVTAVPNDAEGHFQYARALMEIALRVRRPLTEVVNELETAARLAPALDYIRIQLAEVYGRRFIGTFKPERAVELFEEVLKKMPDRYDVRFRFARMILDSEMRLTRSGDPKRVLQDSAWAMDLARFHLEKVIDVAPRDAEPERHKGNQFQ